MESRDGSVGTATRLRTVRSENRVPVRGRFSTPIQTEPGAQPASYTMCTGSSPGTERPGRGLDHLPLTNAEVKENI